MSSDPAAPRRPRRFTLTEARAALPAVRRVTQQAVDAFRAVQHRIMTGDDERSRRDAELALNTIARAWAEHITRLGCEPKGLWLVDFDNGGGYYCWRHPEELLEFFHGYEEGFQRRVRIH